MGPYCGVDADVPRNVAHRGRAAAVPGGQLFGFGVDNGVGGGADGGVLSAVVLQARCGGCMGDCELEQQLRTSRKETISPRDSPSGCFNYF